MSAATIPAPTIPATTLTGPTVTGTVPTGTIPAPATGPEVTYDITLRDGTVQQVVGADAYQPEQSMTTFFRTGGRHTVDCWSVRMASFRTDQILAIRRLEESSTTSGPAELRAV